METRTEHELTYMLAYPLVTTFFEVYNEAHQRGFLHRTLMVWSFKRAPCETGKLNQSSCVFIYVRVFTWFHACLMLQDGV